MVASGWRGLGLWCLLTLLEGDGFAYNQKLVRRRSRKKSMKTLEFECTEFEAVNNKKEYVSKVCDDFRLVVYPRGYRRPGFLAVYLEYIGESTVCITFGLSLYLKNQLVKTLDNNGGALRGGESEWRGGLRFSQSKLSPDKGIARNWGCSAWNVTTLQAPDGVTVRGWLKYFPNEHTNAFACGQVVVPLFSTKDDTLLKMRYGEEYRIMAVDNGNAFFFDPTSENTSLTVRPAYHNRRGPWPLRLETNLTWCSLNDPRTLIPRALYFFRGDTKAENALPFALALWILASIAPLPLVLTATTYIGGLYLIPSSSMEPTLLPGDLLLVENFGLKKPQLSPGEIVVFRPPPPLAKALKGSKKFVKRIAFTQGDSVRLPSSKTIQDSDALPTLCKRLDPGLEQAALDIQGLLVPANTVFLLGDCPGLSVDSRVWGPLPTSYLVGIPTFRVWPPHRFGALLPPSSSPFYYDNDNLR